MGEKNSPLWGNQTNRALENFGRGQTPRELIQAYAQVKLAVYKALQETGHGWEPVVYKALEEATLEIIQGEHFIQFPLSLSQGGAGTSLNQNLNEVIATLTNNRLHEVQINSITDCNRFQSTNDTFSTAATVCFYRELERVEVGVIALQEALIQRERESRTLLILGRTELQDALPMTLAQVFSSWTGMVERDRWRLHKLIERVRTVALGGTALGTGYGAEGSYVYAAERHLRKITGLALSRAQNLTDEVANQDKLAELASGYDLVAGNLWKISGDLLLYTSGLLNEMEHPNLQDGSTQMAAKVNPVLLEYVRGMSLEVQGEAFKARRYAQEGQFQLNAYFPFLVQSILKMSENLLKALEVLGHKLIPSLRFNPGIMEAHLYSSAALFNTLVPLLGYNKVKELSGKFKATQDRISHRVQGSLDTLISFLVEEAGQSPEYWAEQLSPGKITTFTQPKEPL